MSVRVGPGEGLVPPVDGVDVAVNAVVVGARPGAGGAAVLQTLCVRLGQRLEPGEKNLKMAIIKKMLIQNQIDGWTKKYTNIIILDCIVFTLELPSGDTFETLVSLLLVPPSSLWVLLASSWKLSIF